MKVDGMRPGVIVRVRSFTHCPTTSGNPVLSETYTRPKGKKAIGGKYFVFLLLGCDDGEESDGAIDADRFLADAGWTYTERGQ